MAGFRNNNSYFPLLFESRERFSTLQFVKGAKIKGYMLAGADTNRIFISPLMILSTLAVFQLR